MNNRTLVLNVTNQPITAISSKRAVQLVLKDKVEVVSTNGKTFHSGVLEMPSPSVVRLKYYVNIPYTKRTPVVTRKGIFQRDNHQCQYCGNAAENLDHVIPRSKGGPHTWENVVAACLRCNSKKSNRTLAQSGFKLRRKPFMPKNAHTLSLGVLEPDWEPYV